MSEMCELLLIWAGGALAVILYVGISLMLSYWIAKAIEKRRKKQ